MPNLPRSLEYKDRFVYHLIRQINGECEGEPITFPDNTTPIKFVVEMSLNEFTSILSALMTGADLSYPEDSHEVVWRFLRQVECPVSICDEILECLQPAFDEINEKLDNIETKVEVIEENVEANVSQPPNPIVGGADTVLCGAATAVVEQMNLQNEQVYQEAEGGIWDSLMEAFDAVVSAIPRADTIPAGVLASLVQDYFENQYAQYQSDYILARQEMINLLYCQVVEAGGEFTIDVWGDWLNNLDVDIPGNRASSLFARYAPLRQTILNQIAALLNQDNSLQQYFNELYQAFEAGKVDPQGTCGGAACYEPCPVVYDYNNQPPAFVLGQGTLNPDGFIDSELFDPGGCGAQWADFEAEIPATGATMARLIYNNPNPRAVQIYTASGVYIQDVNVPIHIGFELYMHTVTFPAPLTVDIDRVVVRSECGVDAPYQWLRFEVCLP